MRVLPNMVVLVPGDAIETRKAVLAAVEHEGPVYIRFACEKTPVFTTDKSPFAIGKAQILHAGNYVAIVACGPLVYAALLAYKEFEKHGVTAKVVSSPSVKPLDESTIIAAAKQCGAVCELLSGTYPVPVERIGLEDTFGQSGTPDELLEHYKLTAQ